MKFFRSLVGSLILSFLFVSLFSATAFASFYQEVNVTTEIQDVAPSVQIFWKFEHCKELVQRTYDTLPFEHRKGLKNLKLVWSSTMGRGLGGNGTMYLRCNGVGDNELVAVFIHEMGHILDIGVLEGHAAAGSSAFKDKRVSLFNDDESIDFYKISWVSTKQKVSGSSSLDFVSGYAQTDPFEDFAESYIYYILHGQQFSQLAQQNSRLKSKYLYMRDKIFGGIEFIYDLSKPNFRSRPFDTTLLLFPLERFLKKM